MRFAWSPGYHNYIVCVCVCHRVTLFQINNNCKWNHLFLNTWLCWTVRWEWIWGHPVSFNLSCVSENRKPLGRGKLPSCWPRSPASSQPLWASCSEHYSPSVTARVLLLIHCRQSINLNTVLHLSGCLLLCSLYFLRFWKELKMLLTPLKCRENYDSTFFFSSACGSGGRESPLITGLVVCFLAPPAYMSKCLQARLMIRPAPCQAAMPVLVWEGVCEREIWWL